ncbi:hypothetical protein NDU88_007071 [Pleurodeles waltl]|uniref:Secreted protein n=1 Tax=Pleurodeles waltl TaxID=8319 RepID=A0AAV7MFA6_PLEWA|nr:hypothetical protein NDU88_007071 [Pleurodeles waltl]
MMFLIPGLRAAASAPPALGCVRGAHSAVLGPIPGVQCGPDRSCGCCWAPWAAGVLLGSEALVALEGAAVVVSAVGTTAVLRAETVVSEDAVPAVACEQLLCCWGQQLSWHQTSQQRESARCSSAESAAVMVSAVAATAALGAETVVSEAVAAVSSWGAAGACSSRGPRGGSRAVVLLGQSSLVAPRVSADGKAVDQAAVLVSAVATTAALGAESVVSEAEAAAVCSCGVQPCTAVVRLGPAALMAQTRQQW